MMANDKIGNSLLPDRPPSKVIDLMEWGITLTTSEETLRKLDQMERDHALARLRGQFRLFD